MSGEVTKKMWMKLRKNTCLYKVRTHDRVHIIFVFIQYVCMSTHSFFSVMSFEFIWHRCGKKGIKKNTHTMYLCATIFTQHFSEIRRPWIQQWKKKNDYKMSRNIYFLFTKCFVFHWDPVISHMLFWPDFYFLCNVLVHDSTLFEIGGILL